jgi:hypothetical protein
MPTPRKTPRLFLQRNPRRDGKINDNVEEILLAIAEGN